LIVIGSLIGSTFSSKNRIDSSLKGKPLPSFNILLPDSITLLNTNAIPTGKTTIIIGFSPTCPHCEAEIKDIIHNMDRLDKNDFILVTPYAFKEMKYFVTRLGLNKYKNITTGMDSTNIFLSYFKSSSVPYTAIFNKQKMLMGIVEGQTNAEIINQIISQ